MKTNEPTRILGGKIPPWFSLLTMLAAIIGPPRRTMCAEIAAALSFPREQILFNDGWRFQKDDPPGNTVSLLYHVRPEVKDERTDGPADALPQAAEASTVTNSTLAALGN